LTSCGFAVEKQQMVFLQEMHSKSSSFLVMGWKSDIQVVEPFECKCSPSLFWEYWLICYL